MTVFLVYGCYGCAIIANLVWGIRRAKRGEF